MQGISVYERTGSPCWYVAYDCPHRGKRVNESSRIRKDDARSKLKAYAYARDKSMSGVARLDNRERDAWENWVEPWLRDRYRNQPQTLTKYLHAWKQWRVWLHENKVPLPRLLNYEHIVAFVHWRESQVKKQSGRKVSRNTALLDVRAMSRIMREAVRRGFAQGNPCYRLGDDIPRDPPKEKPEFTDEQIALVRAELARRAKFGRPSDWMPIAFEIALHQGCRLSATQIPMERIDFEHGTIQFHEKGSRGRKTVFTAPMHPALRPLLERLKAEGKTVTCTLPRFASRNFGRVMRAMGLPHTFHSTRVSVVTRGARANVSEQKMMGYVHHGSWLVHKIYTRLKPPDVAGVAAALALPEAGATRTGSGPA
jgi:integrase